MLSEHTSYQEAVVGAIPPISGSNIQGVVDYGQYGTQWGNPNYWAAPPLSSPEQQSEVVVVEREYDEQGRVVKETRTTTRPQRLTRRPDY